MVQVGSVVKPKKGCVFNDAFEYGIVESLRYEYSYPIYIRYFDFEFNTHHHLSLSLDEIEVVTE